MGRIFDEIYEIVKRIPKGKVATYGQISSMLNAPPLPRFLWTGKFQMTNSDRRISPRVVGWVLHANKDPKTPCHRVVNKNGRLAPNYAFDGWKEQKRRLLIEGVKFKDNMRVDLEKYIWRPR